MKKVLLSFLLGLLMSSVCSADNLVLKDGRCFDGLFKSRGAGVVTFDADGILLTVPEPEIRELTFGIRVRCGQLLPQSVAVHYQQETGGIVVPTGTIFRVRLQDSIDSSRHRFTAILEADVVVDGVVAIPRGALVYGQLLNAEQACHVLGTSCVTLAFTGVMVNNQIKPMRTGWVEMCNGRSTGQHMLHRTVSGALIGGLVNGRKGARTGAAIGFGFSFLIPGDRLLIPAGTLLDVGLASPFTL